MYPFLGIVELKAQSIPLNKQQTVDYISKLLSSSYRDPNSTKVTSVGVDGKVLVISCDNGAVARESLIKSDTLTIKKLSVCFLLVLEMN